MKKVIVSFSILPILIITFFSCDLSGRNFAWHPTQTPMSKWVGENIELYTLPLDENRKGDLMIVDFGETKLAFYVRWHQNGLRELSLYDKQGIDLWENDSYDYFWVAGFDGKTISETQYLLYSYDTYNLPDDPFPEKIMLNRVATDLSYEDIPEIKTDENYKFCPIYQKGTEWISSDNKTVIVTTASSQHGIGNAIFDNAKNEPLDVIFSKYNSTIYCGNWDFQDPSSILKEAKEIWKCEYFEDYFIATVEYSDHYKAGASITFTKRT